MFARRDGHHTRQPETIQEFPGDSRPSLHKMSSLSSAVYLWGDLPRSPTDTELVSYYRLFLPREGSEIAGGGVGEAVAGNGRAGSARRWCGALGTRERRERGVNQAPGGPSGRDRVLCSLGFTEPARRGAPRLSLQSRGL